MVGTSDRRRLFGLYFGLIVAPSVVLAALYAQSLRREYMHDLADLPHEELEIGGRLKARIQTRVDALFLRENRRHFKHFAREIAVGSDLSILNTDPSPLLTETPPEGVLCWAAIEAPHVGIGGIEMFDQSSGLSAEQSDALFGALSFYHAEFRKRPYWDRISDWNDPHTVAVPITTLGVLVFGDDDEQRDCMSSFAPLLTEVACNVTVTDFRAELVVKGHEPPHVLATRRVLIAKPTGGLPNLPEGAPCVTQMADDFVALIQVFFIDIDWLTQDLFEEGGPRELSACRLATAHDRLDDAGVVVRPLDMLGIDKLGPWANYRARIVEIDPSEMRSRHARGRQQLTGLGMMLLAAVGSGILLLYRRVRIEVEQARRSEDFVAAVTHELRTPLATIRLHGEMLADGWVHDDEVKQSYYQRILNETERLGSMVERILQTSRLKQVGGKQPVGSDLNAELDLLKPRLARPSNDLQFELATDLPPVLLTREELASIVQNLVENARKYAPGPDPVLIRTRSKGDSVLLEVLDRGPGVPPSEREHVFEPFYRVGRELRRETRGTGLGLHLVHQAVLHLGGQVEVESRPGGGSVFRVTLRAAEKLDEPRV